MNNPLSIDAGDPVRQLITAYESAVFAKDVGAFMALYDADANVMDLWGEWQYAGAAAWQHAVTGWFASLGEERVLVDVNLLQSIVTAELAVASAFISYTNVSADGIRQRSMRNRITWTLRRCPMLWKVVHEHSSAPADPASLKVTLAP